MYDTNEKVFSSFKFHEFEHNRKPNKKKETAFIIYVYYLFIFEADGIVLDAPS
jgi:hypothetical protein